MPRKLILDTDPGVDDTMAIAYAMAHPQIELLALTTVFGNCAVDTATRNAQYVLDVLRATSVSVARGAAIPLVQSPHPYPDFVHGKDGLGNCYPSEQIEFDPARAHATESELDAADLIISLARQYPGEIDLVAVGPLSNVAVALDREPELPRLLNQLVIMGGTVVEPGNVSPVAEANFLGDPHAADRVMAADWPATVVGLDVTHRILLGDSHLGKLRDNAAVAGDLIWRTSRFYVDFYSSKGAASGAGEPACAMHDAAAVAYVVMPEAFEVVRGPARVVEDGIAAGQFILSRENRPYALPHWENRPSGNGACLSVDSERVRADFLDTLCNWTHA